MKKLLLYSLSIQERLELCRAIPEQHLYNKTTSINMAKEKPTPQLIHNTRRNIPLNVTCIRQITIEPLKLRHTTIVP